MASPRDGELKQQITSVVVVMMRTIQPPDNFLIINFMNFMNLKKEIQFTEGKVLTEMISRVDKLSYFCLKKRM